MITTLINGSRGEFYLFQLAKSHRRYLLIRLESITSYSTYKGSYGFDCVVPIDFLTAALFSYSGKIYDELDK